MADSIYDNKMPLTKAAKIHRLYIDLDSGQTLNDYMVNIANSIESYTKHDTIYIIITSGTYNNTQVKCVPEFLVKFIGETIESNQADFTFTILMRGWIKLHPDELSKYTKAPIYVKSSARISVDLYTSLLASDYIKTSHYNKTFELY